MDPRELAREDWPSGLFEIPVMPKRLWIRGSLPSPDHRLLAVVGSRAMTRYGQEACEMLISGLSGYPVSVVSGLALGVDACAHKAALRAELHTIAVPGSGLRDEVLYPRAHRKLANDIVNAGGCLLSEYAPETTARPYHFPERNRLMVGMADAVLVIEAGPQSGTLITARLAGEYNRDLLCVPHRIGDVHGFGSHLFIRLGATLVSESVHILETLRITPKEITATQMPNDLAPGEQVIWDMLDEPKTRDEVLRIARARTTGPQTGELLTALVSLELRGLIKEEFGAWRRV